MKILFLGAPGSGKSTQGQILASDNGWVWLSSGELCRNSGDPEILEVLKGSKLISDDIVSKMVLEAINENSEAGFILDGFPRNRRQCEILDENNIEIDLILEIAVPKEELLARVALRGREQDSEATLLERIDMYEKSRDEIVSYYSEKGVKCEIVNGVGEIEEIAKRVKEAIL